MGSKLFGLIAVFYAATSLAGCASVTGANERGGMISLVTGFNKTQAFEMADKHCRQFGRVARISTQDGMTNSISFDCVAP